MWCDVIRKLFTTKRPRLLIEKYLNAVAQNDDTWALKVFQITCHSTVKSLSRLTANTNTIALYYRWFVRERYRPVIGEFPTLRASNAERVSMLWRYIANSPHRDRRVSEQSVWGPRPLCGRHGWVCLWMWPRLHGWPLYNGWECQLLVSLQRSVHIARLIFSNLLATDVQ